MKSRGTLGSARTCLCTSLPFTAQPEPFLLAAWLDSLQQPVAIPTAHNDVPIFRIILIFSQILDPLEHCRNLSAFIFVVTLCI